MCQFLEREVRCKFGVGAEHLGFGLAQHLEVSERIVELSRAMIEIVAAERLLKNSFVLALRKRNHRGVVVRHVMPADDIGRVGETVGMTLVRGA